MACYPDRPPWGTALGLEPHQSPTPVSPVSPAGQGSGRPWVHGWPGPGVPSERTRTIQDPDQCRRDPSPGSLSSARGSEASHMHSTGRRRRRPMWLGERLPALSCRDLEDSHPPPGLVPRGLPALPGPRGPRDCLAATQGSGHQPRRHHGHGTPLPGAQKGGREWTRGLSVDSLGHSV